jgi:hypothetical protein
MTSNPARMPAGVTTGGQFATSARGEADISLTGPGAPAPAVFTFEVDLLADTDPAAAPGTVAARRRLLAELAAESTWDEENDPSSWQPAVESSSIRFQLKHNADRRDLAERAETPAQARAALRGSRSPGRFVHVRLDDHVEDPIEVTGHATDPIQVELPGFGVRVPLRVTKGTAVIHAGGQNRAAPHRGETAKVDVTVAPGANVLVFGTRRGEVNVTVEGDGVAAVVGERDTTGTLVVTGEGSIDAVGPTSTRFTVHEPGAAPKA